jgi:hypothetical protein
LTSKELLQSKDFHHLVTRRWVLTATYVVWANRNYDPEAQQLRDRLHG